MSYLIYRKNGFVPIRIIHRDPHIVTAVMESTFKQEYGSQYVEMDECPELAALRERVAKLEASNARLFDDLHNQIHQTVGAEMERDKLREQVAEVNELLFEFAENPNIELGEKGHNKIEDYFKKYTDQESN